MSRLDWLGALQWVPISRQQAVSGNPPLTGEALAEAIHCVTARGRVLAGIEALRFIGLRLPLVAPLALVLWLPGIAWLARWAYGWVSRHRQGISRWLGCETACHRPTG